MAARNGYVAKQSSDLYVTDGDQIDWMYGEVPDLLVHLRAVPDGEGRPSGPTTTRDDSLIAAQTERNRTALLHLIDRAACPYADLGGGHAAADCGPLFDDLEINRGWVRNAAGTDTATSGRWAVGNPQPTSSGGAKQLGTTVSGIRALVTGAAAGSSAGANDVDGGTTTIRSRVIRLPADPAAYGNLTFSWVFAHSATSSRHDALRVLVEAEDGTQTVVFEVLGRPVNVNGSWRTASVPLAAWAGQAIHLVVAAIDGAKGNLVEAAIDDIRIRRP